MEFPKITTRSPNNAYSIRLRGTSPLGHSLGGLSSLVAAKLDLHLSFDSLFTSLCLRLLITARGQQEVPSTGCTKAQQRIMTRETPEFGRLQHHGEASGKRFNIRIQRQTDASYASPMIEAFPNSVQRVRFSAGKFNLA